MQRRSGTDELRQRLAQAEEALHAAQAAAEEARQVRSDVLAHMSHELRTPLTAIIGFSEVLADGSCGPLTRLQAEYVRHILDSGHQLLGMINDLLELAELRDLELVPVDLGSLALEAAAHFARRAAQQEVRVDVDVQPGLPAVMADARQLQKSLEHLLRHALEVTPAGARVHVGVRAGAPGAAGTTAGEVVASVTDGGPSLAPEPPPAEPGAPAGGAIVDGLGLGLSLAHRLVELQGGRMWWESGGGAGTTFHVAVPVAGEHAACAARRGA